MIRVLYLLLAAAIAPPAPAGPLAPHAVPEPLRPWIDWVLWAQEDRTCPAAHDAPERRLCVWPGELELALDEDGGRFVLQARAYAPAWLPLPGGRVHWPQDVRLDGRPAEVLPRGDVAALWLAPGSHSVEGRFAWDRLPEALALPAGAGIVRLELRGVPVPFPEVRDDGRLWLGGGEDRQAAPADTLRIEVYRRIVDTVPMQVVTELDLEVGGRAREAVLGPVLLEGLVPLAIGGGLPARLEDDGRLRVQLRPGRFVLRVTGRATGERTALELAPRPPPWPQAEVWVFDARREVRLVEVEGVPAVDPRQTGLPHEWQALPAYRVGFGDTLRLAVIRRGDPQPEPNRLSLARSLRLDFDGAGYTVHDRLEGTVTQGWRLEVTPDLMLGRVAVDGRPQLVTTRAGSERRGVEVRRGHLVVEADSRWERGVGDIAAVGWDHDVQRLEATLHLPPGWTLLAARGADRVATTWVARWTLLDLFLVLVAALAVARLWNGRAGLLALAALALVWHEPGAPRTVWLHLLAAVALLRVLPDGRARIAVRWYRNAALLVLAGIALPFAAELLRTGLFPQLERPQQPIVAEAAAPAAAALRSAAPRHDALAPEEGIQTLEKVAETPPAARPAERALDEPDPNARLQTGPGVPHWQWHAIELGWSGPVARDQRLRLWLLSPRANLALDVLRVLLVLALGWRMLRPALPGRPARPPGTVAAGALLLAVLAPGARAADIPDAALLEELRARLTAPPDCAPVCAALPRMQLDVQPGLLMLRLELVAAAPVAVPLPGGADEWLPADVRSDGAPAQERLRRHGGTLWLALEPGTVEITMLGPLPSRATVALPLPLPPQRVEVGEVAGWTIEGIRDDGRPESQLRLIRSAGGGSGEASPAGEAPAAGLPPFLRVERTLRLDREWSVQTHVERVCPDWVAAPGSPPQAACSDAPVVLAVPLLAGESVITEGMHVDGGAVRVNLTPRERAVRWRSALEHAPRIELAAAETGDWIEVWRLDAGSMWHVETEGIAAVHHTDRTGRWLPEWRPWPGERVALAISRPEGVAGPTLTLDRAALALRPGRRSTDTELALTLRSSQGGQHTVTLPEHARLQSVSIDGTAQPVRQDGARVTLPVRPGTQEIALAWRTPAGIGARLVTPAIDLGAPAVNVGIEVALGEDRWVIATAGPRLGPAVLFWGVVIVVSLVALVLGRLRLTPLGSTAWFLLGLGLSQVSIWLALVVVGWLLALGLRARLETSPLLHDLAQVGLALATVAALAILFHAIEQGLLGAPQMQIAGNGSSAQRLLWYQDRSAAALPQASVVSAPLAAYRLLMLGWALWLAFALLGWLRWGWRCCTAGGLWRPLRARVAQG